MDSKRGGQGESEEGKRKRGESHWEAFADPPPSSRTLLLVSGETFFSRYSASPPFSAANSADPCTNATPSPQAIDRVVNSFLRTHSGTPTTGKRLAPKTKRVRFAIEWSL